jgi:opacity protein-like surface antigen
MQIFLVANRPSLSKLIQLILLPLIASAISPAQAQIAAPGGTYVRIEAGGTFHQNVTFSDTDPGAANCDLCAAQFPSSVADSFLVGGALGYRIGPDTRLDLSVDYLGSTKLSGHSTAAVPSTGSANLDSVVGLLNGYIDLPLVSLFGPIQPYIDGGIGVARNALGQTAGNSGAVGPFTLSGASRTNFAWALGAGVGYPLTPHLILDLAYRFLDIGQLRTDSTLGFGGISATVTPSRTEAAVVHTVTIGLRYEF